MNRGKVEGVSRTESRELRRAKRRIRKLRNEVETQRRPNTLLGSSARVADSTKHSTAWGKTYSCAKLNRLTMRIVGHAISHRMTADLAKAALRTILTRLEPQGVVSIHADRSDQFRAHSFQAAPKAPCAEALWRASHPPATTQPETCPDHSYSATS